MKIRCGFVSNSSSASFVLNLDNLNFIQIGEINKILKKNDEFSNEDYHIDSEYYIRDYDFWLCEISDNKLSGRTFMDNDCLLEFFKSIDVPETEYTIITD